VFEVNFSTSERHYKASLKISFTFVKFHGISVSPLGFI